MRLSLAAELAVRGSIVLAQHHGDGPVPLAEICRERELPKQYLTKIFTNLVKAGLVTAVRGKHGGYTLGRAPSEITILEIKSERIDDPQKVANVRHELELLSKVWSDSVTEDKVIAGLHQQLKTINE